MEAGVLIRSDGREVLHAPRPVPNAITVIIFKIMFTNRRSDMAGFYQFLLQSLQSELFYPAVHYQDLRKTKKESTNLDEIRED